MALPEYQQQQPIPPDVLAELARLRAENERLRSERSWRNRLDANTAVSAQQKIVLACVRFEWERLRKNSGAPDLASGEDPNPIPIYVEDIARMCGVSRGTAGDTLKDLAKMGAIYRREYHDKASLTGLFITRFAFAPTRAALDDPEHLAPAAPRNHGGKRKTCDECGSERIIERRQIICEDCGHILSTHTHYVNGPADELDGAPDLTPEPAPEPEPDSPTVATTPEILPASQDDSPGQENEDRPDTESDGYEPW